MVDLDDGEVAFLAARVRRLCKTLEYPMPDTESDEFVVRVSGSLIGGVLTKVDALKAELRDGHWPHGATVKLRWSGTGYRDKHGWAKRNKDGQLVSVVTEIELDTDMREIVQERKDSSPSEAGG